MAGAVEGVNGREILVDDSPKVVPEVGVVPIFRKSHDIAGEELVNVHLLFLRQMASRSLHHTEGSSDDKLIHLPLTEVAA
jgi:hypothetical protein